LHTFPWNICMCPSNDTVFTPPITFQDTIFIDEYVPAIGFSSFYRVFINLTWNSLYGQFTGPIRLRCNILQYILFVTKKLCECWNCENCVNESWSLLWIESYYFCSPPKCLPKVSIGGLVSSQDPEGCIGGSVATCWISRTGQRWRSRLKEAYRCFRLGV